MQMLNAYKAVSDWLSTSHSQCKKPHPPSEYRSNGLTAPKIIITQI